MTRECPPSQRGSRGRGDDRGSALVLAIFVLVILTGMGTALLFMSQNQYKMNQADVRAKRAFYLAEAGLEEARVSLWQVNGNGPFQDDLEAAANAIDDIEFDPSAITVTRDANGRPTGFGGYGDDNPLVGLTVFDDGAYIAFLTNDPGEPVGAGGIAGRTTTYDSNDTVMITSIGAGPDNSLEIVQAVVEHSVLVPSVPPAAITMLGPTPSYASGTSKVKVYEGEDCGGAGVPGLYVPIVGAIGSDAIANAETGINANPTFESGTYTDAGTFEDLMNPAEPLVADSYGPIDDSWNDCESWIQIIETIRLMADVTCADGTELGDTCVEPPLNPANRFFGDGDLYVGPGPHMGMLLVTGELTMNGNASWSGLIMAVGEGYYLVNGAGNGLVSGGVIIVDVAGPDNVYGTDDDCQGSGTGDHEGFEPAYYNENGGGNAGTVYCTTDLTASWPPPPYEIREFLQR
jgi:hypothetical protein